MTYAQTLDYLYNTLPMFSRIGSAAFKKDLTNIRALCVRLNNPHLAFKSIHIGGTNGKGSVSHMLAAVLQTSGYKTGLYTSPHLYDFRERIKINGVEVSEDFVVRFVKEIQPAIEEIKPSFFEITVAMAFQYFKEQQVDVAVIEVGLGGRLDSTNIITPELSVITNISWDHMNLLGDSLPQIAGEKAGIIKPNIPVVIGEKQAETAAIFRETAAERKAPIYFADERFSVADVSMEMNGLQLSIEDRQHGDLKKFALDLTGLYQTKNLINVLQAVDLLHERHFNISEIEVQEALGQTKKITGLHGRWEVIHQNPAVILEVAHNEAGIEQMLAHLKLLKYKMLHLVVGFVKDKELDGVLKLLPQSATYYFTNAHIPRALDAESLQQKAATFNLNGEAFENVNAALESALSHAQENDLILVCGSIFLVAEVKQPIE